MDWKVAPFSCTWPMRSVTDAPVACEVAWSSPRTLPVWLASTLKMLMACATASTSSAAVVPVFSPNSRNCSERISSASPVTPNLTLTAPTVSPMSDQSALAAAALVPTFLTEAESASAAAPVAPVLRMASSVAVSTDSNAASDAAATPATAVSATPLALLTVSPIEPYFSPTSSSLVPSLPRADSCAAYSTRAVSSCLV